MTEGYEGEPGADLPLVMTGIHSPTTTSRVQKILFHLLGWVKKGLEGRKQGTSSKLLILSSTVFICFLTIF